MKGDGLTPETAANSALAIKQLEKSNLSTDERMDICSECENLKMMMICSECGCFMPIKAAIPLFHCPINKW